MSDTVSIEYSYADIPISYGTVMVSDEDKIRAVLRFYPEYAEHWNSDESVLWNYIDAVARDQGVEHDIAKQILAQACDPIWGGSNAEVIGRWMFFLA